MLADREHLQPQVRCCSHVQQRIRQKPCSVRLCCAIRICACTNKLNSNMYLGPDTWQNLIHTTMCECWPRINNSSCLSAATAMSSIAYASSLSQSASAVTCPSAPAQEAAR